MEYVHPISQPTSNYIKRSSFRTIYLIGALWLSLSVFVIRYRTQWWRYL